MFPLGLLNRKWHFQSITFLSHYSCWSKHPTSGTSSKELHPELHNNQPPVHCRSEETQFQEIQVNRKSHVPLRKSGKTMPCRGTVLSVISHLLPSPGHLAYSHVVIPFPGWSFTPKEQHWPSLHRLQSNGIQVRAVSGKSPHSLLLKIPVSQHLTHLWVFSYVAAMSEGFFRSLSLIKMDFSIMTKPMPRFLGPRRTGMTQE